MECALRAGVAIFNEGNVHDAHDAWEAQWLQESSGSDDEFFLHGLIQYTASVYHATNDNHTGTKGLAQSALTYLSPLPAVYRSVSLTPIRHVLAALTHDPTIVYRTSMLPIIMDGNPVTYADLRVNEHGIVAGIIAHKRTGFDPSVLETASSFAKSETGRGPFSALLDDFVRNTDHQSLIYERISQHVSREVAKESDVDDLFSNDYSS